MKLTPQQLLEDLGIHYSPKTNRLAICCPFHPDTDPSSAFYLDTELFFCFACDITLDMIQFYAKHKELTRPQAEQELTRKYGDVPEKKIRNTQEITIVRGRAEKILAGKIGSGRLVHAAHGERLDKILWVFDHNLITRPQFEAAMQQWYKDVEEGNAPGHGSDVTPTNSTSDRLQESFRPVPGSGYEDGAVDLD